MGGSNNTRRKQVRNFASQLQRELNEAIIPECLEIIMSTTSEIRTYNERETTDSFTKAHNTYAEMLLNNTLDKEDIENINAYPKKKPKKYFFTNQPTTTNRTSEDKSYAQITKSSSEESIPQPQDITSNKISENQNNTIELKNAEE